MIKRVESISQALESSFGHVICSDNSTLTNVRKTEASNVLQNWDLSFLLLFWIQRLQHEEVQDNLLENNRLYGTEVSHHS